MGGQSCNRLSDWEAPLPPPRHTGCFGSGLNGFDDGEVNASFRFSFLFICQDCPEKPPRFFRKHDNRLTKCVPLSNNYIILIVMGFFMVSGSGTAAKKKQRFRFSAPARKRLLNAFPYTVNGSI
jgi:hypothetical protein